MLQDTQLIDYDPVLDDLALSDAGIDEPLGHDRIAGRWVAQKQSFVRAAHCPVRRDFVSLHDFIFDDAVKIGERSSEHGDQLFESHSVGGRSPTQMMADAIGRDQLIHDSEVAPVEGFIKNAADDGFALNG